MEDDNEDNLKNKEDLHIARGHTALDIKVGWKIKSVEKHFRTSGIAILPWLLNIFPDNFCKKSLKNEIFPEIWGVNN